MLKIQEHDLIVAGRRVHYLEAGAGPVLVLLHGTAIDSARLSYGSSLPVLAKHYRVLAPDWPGYGESEHPPEVPGISDYIGLLSEFTAALRLPPFHLLGFSMGGAVALGTALALPERVRSLILVSSYGLGRSLHLPIVPYLALRTPRLSANVLLGLRFSKRLTRLALERLIFADARAVTPDLVDAVHKQLKRPLVERAFLAWLRGELGPLRYQTNYRKDIRQLTQPSLLLHGSRDLVVPARNAKWAATHLPGASLEVLPRTGHWLMREQPTAFEKAVLAFLARFD